MEPEEDDATTWAQLRQSLGRAYDPDTAKAVDDRMIAMMLQLSSDEEPRPPVRDDALDRPRLAARLFRSLRRRQ